MLRPALSVALLNAGRRVECTAVVDSGADFCVFPMSLVAQLELLPQASKQVPGITGYGYNDERPLLFWTVTMEIGRDFSLSTMIGFSEDQEGPGFGLLGQRGFSSEVEQVSFNHGAAGFAFKTRAPTSD